MAGAARIAALPLQPAQGVLEQVDRPLLGITAAAVGRAVVAKQVDKGGGDLFGGATRFLTLQGMPVTAVDRQPALQILRKAAAVLGPAGGRCALGCGGHWTGHGDRAHPDAMATGPRPRRRRPGERRPGERRRALRGGWLHSFSRLLALGERGRRLSAPPARRSSGERRLTQRLELGRRLLDPVPPALRASRWAEEALWTGLRWGGAGLLLAWWLRR